MGFVRRWVLNNWLLKLLALAISFLLWATYTSQPLAEAGYMVPIVFRNLPPGTSLSGEELTQVHVVVRGRATLLRQLEPSDLAVTVGLAGRREGSFTVRLSEDNIDRPPGAEIARISPAEIKLRLMPRAAQ